ncbi:hypothetical protein PMZ80_008557 [Knufia obscura]|uniref:Major facilitator superfamily (MFS) profile domain-containing protein n=1 Tax=Knufia obscura TaxID=1635080 RepID=A0ABR0RF67_9EURO|nr:hypothetical protein PMZ80_008557 [Knufia obscura]
MLFDSLIDHFTSRSSEFEKKRPADIETNMSKSLGSSESTLAHNTEKPEQPWKPTRTELGIMITLAICSLVVALDATILVPVLPTVAVGLHGTTSEAFWTGTSYLLSHAVLQPLIATLSDIFGRRALLTPSILFFAIGSLICALSHNFPTMLTGRVVQGIGGAGIIILSQLLYADLVPLRLRPKYFTLVLGAWALGSVLGPLIGGLLVEKASWRWCFYLNLPICGLALPMAIFFLSHLNDSMPHTSLATKLKSIDYIGLTLFIASLTSLLIAISDAGISHPWLSWQTIVPLVLGGVGIILALTYEMQLATHPFLPKSIFTSSSSIASYFAAMLQGLTLYMALYYASFYFSATHFFRPIRTGLSVFPATTLMLPGSAVVSALITRTGHFRWAIWAGFTISTVSCGTFILWDENTSTPVWAACECFFGLGMGMLLSSLNFAIQASVNPEDAGRAAGMYAFARSVGMTVGVAVGGAVFQNVMRGRLEGLGVPRADEIAKGAEGFIGRLEGMDGTGEEGVLRGEIMEGYVVGFRGVWICMMGLCGVGLVVSLLIRRASLDKVLQSRFTVRREEK